jgi:hypothetical protein
VATGASQGGEMTNAIIDTYLDQTYFSLYQRLRNQLMDELSDDDLEARLGGDSETLGALCREIGEIEHTYVESFRSFRQDFSYRNPDPMLEHSVQALKAWFDELDRDLMASLAALSNDDIERRKIVRSDFEEAFFAPLPRVQLDIYREALLIFYGKVSVYMKAIGTPRSQQWRDWIG